MRPSWSTPQHVKNVPGRKTDVQDAEWLADLLRHGLLHASFVPPPESRDLRRLTRYRTTLVRQRADECNRIQKLLETCNIKLASVAADVLGVSGRNILEALCAGQDDPETLAQMAKGRLRPQIPQLIDALNGQFTPRAATAAGGTAPPHRRPQRGHRPVGHRSPSR